MSPEIIRRAAMFNAVALGINCVLLVYYVVHSGEGWFNKIGALVAAFCCALSHTALVNLHTRYHNLKRD